MLVKAENLSRIDYRDPGNPPHSMSKGKILLECDEEVED
jgi:hypothetical protein